MDKPKREVSVSSWSSVEWVTRVEDVFHQLSKAQQPKPAPAREIKDVGEFLSPSTDRIFRRNFSQGYPEVSRQGLEILPGVKSTSHAYRSFLKHLHTELQNVPQAVEKDGILTSDGRTTNGDGLRALSGVLPRYLDRPPPSATLAQEKVGILQYQGKDSESGRLYDLIVGDCLSLIDEKTSTEIRAQSHEGLPGAHYDVGLRRASRIEIVDHLFENKTELGGYLQIFRQTADPTKLVRFLTKRYLSPVMSGTKRSQAEDPHKRRTTYSIKNEVMDVDKFWATKLLGIDQNEFFGSVRYRRAYAASQFTKTIGSLWGGALYQGLKKMPAYHMGDSLWQNRLTRGAAGVFTTDISKMDQNIPNGFLDRFCELVGTKFGDLVGFAAWADLHAPVVLQPMELNGSHIVQGHEDPSRWKENAWALTSGCWQNVVMGRLWTTFVMMVDCQQLGLLPKRVRENEQKFLGFLRRVQNHDMVGWKWLCNGDDILNIFTATTTYHQWFQHVAKQSNPWVDRTVARPSTFNGLIPRATSSGVEWIHSDDSFLTKLLWSERPRRLPNYNVAKLKELGTAGDSVIIFKSAGFRRAWPIAHPARMAVYADNPLRDTLWDLAKTSANKFGLKFFDDFYRDAWPLREAMAQSKLVLSPTDIEFMLKPERVHYDPRVDELSPAMRAYLGMENGFTVQETNELRLKITSVR